MASVKEAALVTAIYERLGFEESSPTYKTFKATCHAWTESYKNRTCIQESDLTKWKSPSVRLELHKMAESFLMDHGFEYWPPQTDDVETLQYPCDEERITEQLEQLFWRFNFNSYRYHRYVRKGVGDEQESSISYESSVSNFEKTPGYTEGVGNHIRPITLSGGPSVAHGNLVDIASATMQMSELPDFTTSTLPTEARDVRWLDANAQTTESIAPGEEDLSAPARKKPVVKLRIHSLATIGKGPGVSQQHSHSKISKDQGDRTRDPSYNDTSVDTEHVPQRRKLTHGAASSPKRMAHGSPAKTLRSSKRKRTQNPRYVDDISDVDMTDSDKSELGESPETRSRGRRSKVVEQTSPTDTRHSKPRSSQQRSLSSETNDISFFRREWNKAKEMNTTTLAEGSSAHQTPPSDTDILSRVAPTAVMISPPSDTSGLQTIIPVPNDAPKLPSIEEESRQAASPLPEVQRKVPPAEMGGQEKAQPVPHDQSKPRKPRPEFKIAYTIVKTRTPRLHLSVWEDGTFAGRSLQSVVESISRIVGRGQIETLTCTLYTPEMNKDFTIKKDAESTFESMKHEYGKMMLSSYRRLGQKKPFEIQIEPAYSDERRDESYSDSEASGLDGW